MGGGEDGEGGGEGDGEVVFGAGVALDEPGEGGGVSGAGKGVIGW